MTTLVQVLITQANFAVGVNDNFQAGAIAAGFGVKNSLTVGLTFGYYGATLNVDGVLTVIADGTLVLTASTTNYIERTRAGVVSVNQTGFTAGNEPLYTALCGTGTISVLTDCRTLNYADTGRLSKSVAGTGSVTLTQAEANNDILEFTGVLTGAKTVVVPNASKQFTVANLTSGAYTLTIKTPAGTGIVVATGKRAILYADGTNVVRVTADT